MDDKLLDMKMEEHLSNTRWDIRVALQRFEQIGVKIDRKFRREFIKKTNDCVADTCDRYNSERKHKTPRRERDNTPDVKYFDKKNSKQNQSSVDSSEKRSQKSKPAKESSPIKRKHENDSCADGQENKRSRSVDGIDSSIPMDLCKSEEPRDCHQPEHPIFFYYCAHCVDANESGDWIGGSIDDVYKHWQLVHIISKPFQFYVAQTAVCQFGDAIGTFRELLKHHQQVHPNEMSAVVCHDDQKKCGICLKSVDAVRDHFEKEHKTIVKKKLFNPMRLSDVGLDELIKIDVHSKRQCGHCDAIFETENEIDIHYSIGHENQEKISRLVTDNRDPFLICGYCQHKVSRELYLSHIKSHPYVFKCYNCAYESKNLIDLIFHDKKTHDRDTLDYHCTVFPDWLNGFFCSTKVVFPNGLVLRNYNLIGTKFDDSKMFDVFIDGLVELIKSKYELLSINTKSPIDTKEVPDDERKPTLEDSEFLLAELSRQNELANSLLLLKMPRLLNMSLPNMLLLLCDKLNVKVSGSDIESIHRRGDTRESNETLDSREGRYDILVNLKSYELKEEIRLAAQKHQIFSGTVFDLHPDEWSKQIKVISLTTRYYSEMLSIAREARLDRIIHHYELTKHGIHIKRSATSDDRIFISKSELMHFINRSKYE